MAQQMKVLEAKSKNLSSIPKTYRGEGERQCSQVVLWPPQSYSTDTHMPNPPPVNNCNKNLLLGKRHIKHSENRISREENICIICHNERVDASRALIQTSFSPQEVNVLLVTWKKKWARAVRDCKWKWYHCTHPTLRKVILQTSGKGNGKKWWILVKV